MLSANTPLSCLSWRLWGKQVIRPSRMAVGKKLWLIIIQNVQTQERWCAIITPSFLILSFITWGAARRWTQSQQTFLSRKSRGLTRHSTDKQNPLKPEMRPACQVYKAKKYLCFFIYLFIILPTLFCNAYGIFEESTQTTTNISLQESRENLTIYLEDKIHCNSRWEQNVQSVYIPARKLSLPTCRRESAGWPTVLCVPCGECTRENWGSHVPVGKAT